jgi:hypothetical protein
MKRNSVSTTTFFIKFIKQRDLHKPRKNTLPSNTIKKKIQQKKQIIMKKKENNTILHTYYPYCSTFWIIKTKLVTTIERYRIF